jgi:hypothetical protein
MLDDTYRNKPSTTEEREENPLVMPVDAGVARASTLA